MDPTTYNLVEAAFFVIVSGMEVACALDLVSPSPYTRRNLLSRLVFLAAGITGIVGHFIAPDKVSAIYLGTLMLGFCIYWASTKN